MKRKFLLTYSLLIALFIAGCTSKTYVPLNEQESENDLEYYLKNDADENNINTINNHILIEDAETAIEVAELYCNTSVMHVKIAKLRPRSNFASGAAFI